MGLIENIRAGSAYGLIRLACWLYPPLMSELTGMFWQQVADTIHDEEETRAIMAAGHADTRGRAMAQKGRES